MQKNVTITTKNIFSPAKEGEALDTKSTHKSNTQLSEKYKPLWKCSKRFIPPHTDEMIRFYCNIGCSESKVIFKWRKATKTNKKALQGTNVRTSCISFSLSQNSHRTTQTNAVNKRTQKSPPRTCDKGCAEACAERFSALKDQHWRHVVSSPSRGHFRNVFVKSSEMLGFWSFICL